MYIEYVLPKYFSFTVKVCLHLSNEKKADLTRKPESPSLTSKQRYFIIKTK